MTRNDLVREFRLFTQDTVEPYLWETADILRWLEEAEREAAVRGRLLHESADPAMCAIAVSAGRATYPLHPLLYELDHIAFRGELDPARCRLRLVSAEWLDDHLPDWRDRTGRPEYAIQGETSIRLVPTPDAEGALLLEGYRLPVRPEPEADPGPDDDTKGMGATSFEIHEAHHRNLLDWLLFRAYSVPDSEVLDLGRAGDAERAFTAYFGQRPDADLRRMTREDEDHHNKSWV